MNILLHLFFNVNMFLGVSKSVHLKNSNINEMITISSYLLEIFRMCDTLSRHILNIFFIYFINKK